MTCFGKGINRLENPIPAPKAFVRTKVLTYHFGTLRRNRVHQYSRNSNHIEAIDQDLPAKGIIILFFGLADIPYPILIRVPDI